MNNAIKAVSGAIVALAGAVVIIAGQIVVFEDTVIFKYLLTTVGIVTTIVGLGTWLGFLIYPASDGQNKPR